jgi:DNA-binding CsgD family transcriptional regulator
LALIRKADHEQFAGAFHTFLFYEDDQFLLEQKFRKYAGLQNGDNENKQLSQREITILKWIVKGLTHQEIADKLFLSIHTVNTHRKNINKKLGIKTVSGLSVYAIMNHLIEMNELADKR